jgi:hypothetical protein
MDEPGLTAPHLSEAAEMARTFGVQVGRALLPLRECGDRLLELSHAGLQSGEFLRICDPGVGDGTLKRLPAVSDGPLPRLAV